MLSCSLHLHKWVSEWVGFNLPINTLQDTIGVNWLISVCSKPTCHGASTCNRLQLNALKTEFIWCAPARRRHHIPNRDVQVGHDSVIRSSHPETLVCTSTVVWRWGHTSTTCCRHVMVPAPLWLFSEFGAVYKYSDLLTYLLTETAQMD